MFKALSTSIGQKFLMGITGLLLCGFLVVHLAGNLFLFVGESAYNDYAHKLHSQEALLKVAEVGLFGLFLIHIALAIVTGRQNRRARGPVGYLNAESKQAPTAVPNGGARSWMFATGAIVLGFVLLHLVDFTWQVRPDLEYEVIDQAGMPVLDSATGEGVQKEPFDKAKMILTNPISAAIYVIGCVVLGIHLSHGVGSALQSLGVNHPRWNCWIRCCSLVFGFLIATGFCSFVAWAFLFSH